MEIIFKSSDETRIYSVNEETFDRILYFAKNEIKETRMTRDEMD